MAINPEFGHSGEFSTADAAEEFLRGIKEIHEKQRSESSLDQDAARIQAKEFALQTAQIIEQVESYPEQTWILPGIFKGSMTYSGLGIHPEAANIPIGFPIATFRIKGVEDRGSLEQRLMELGVTPNYELEFMNSLSNFGMAEDPHINSYYFDEQGNFIKVQCFSKSLNHDLPEFRPSSSFNYYIATMEPEDFELVGFTLDFLNKKLN